MTGGTVISRLTGIVRLAVIAATLGVAESRIADTYNLANTAPNVIYELVLGGVVSSAFIPLFVELLQKEDRERAWQVMSGILNLSLLILSGIAILGMIGAPWIARFYASRLPGVQAQSQQEAITFLLRLFIPQIVLYGLYFIVSGILTAHRRFGPPMYTPIINNFVVIAAFVLFGTLYGAVTLATVTRPQLLLMGLGTTLSVAPMGLALLPYLRRLGPYRLTLKVGHPAARRMARLSVFVVGSVAANQLAYIFIQWLANGQRGGFSAYISASTFFLLPIGLFVWSLSTALMPSLSEYALHSQWPEYRDRLSIGLRATAFLMLPSAVGYVVLGEPIVRLLLQHGIMTASSTELVAGVLQLMVLGLLQFSIFQLLTRAFYAMQDTKTPFLVNCAVVVLNTAINVPMFAWLEVRGLAAGQAIAYSVGVFVLGRLLASRVGAFQTGQMRNSMARIAAAAGGMGLLVWLCYRAIDGLWPGGGILIEALTVVVPVAVGVAAYFALGNLFRVEELEYVKLLLGRKFAPGPGASPQ
ncbi:MAG: murein biosynthesis integral membrane protein MurJ [Actinomycetota bacterium]|nr:murein biosynthesis integral membrane protein MurJ [Actinomycetota bacterium]